MRVLDKKGVVMITQIDITGIHYELKSDIKKYIHKKIGRLDRFVPRDARGSVKAEVFLKERKTKVDRNECEIILHLPEKQITAKEATVNMFAAVDIVENKLKNQLRKYKASHGGDKTDHRGKLRKLFRRRPPTETDQ
jgi:ribosomal subunit interface protein